MILWGWVLSLFIAQLEPEIPLERLRVAEMFRPSLPQSLPTVSPPSFWNLWVFTGQGSGARFAGGWGEENGVGFLGIHDRDYALTDSGNFWLNVSRETGRVLPFAEGAAFAVRRRHLTHRFEGHLRLGLGVWVENTYGEAALLWKGFAWGEAFRKRRHFAGGEARLYSILTPATMVLVGTRGRSPLDPAPEWEGTFFNLFFFKLGRISLWLGGSASLGVKTFIAPRLGAAWTLGNLLIRGSWKEETDIVSLSLLPGDREIPQAPFLERVRTLTVEVQTLSAFLRYRRLWPDRYILLGPTGAPLEVQGFSFGVLEFQGETAQPPVTLRGWGKAVLFGKVLGFPYLTFDGGLSLTFSQRLRLEFGEKGRGTYQGFHQTLPPIWIPRLSLALRFLGPYTLFTEVENPLEGRYLMLPEELYTGRRIRFGIAREATF